MENQTMIHNLIHQIHHNEKIHFVCQEQYYFALAQALTATFIKLGGIDRYRHEFNYLTNPYLPMPIYGVAKRILRFLNRSKKKVPTMNPALEKTLDTLLSSGDDYITPKINIKEAELAFYEGLHHNSLLGD